MAGARAAPGVICILTGKSVAGSQLPPHLMPEDMGRPNGYRAIRPVAWTISPSFVILPRSRFCSISVAQVSGLQNIRD